MADQDRDASVTGWIRGVEAGDPAAAERLWRRYFERLVRVARRKLEGRARRVADEEDVALSAFHSFCRAAADGRIPRLADRNDLWRVLIGITARKVVDLIRYNSRRKRRALGESAIGRLDEDGQGAGLDRMVGSSPSPEFAAQVADECRHLMASLGDRDLRSVAIAKMEGLSNEEIAREKGCSVRTVERQLHLIRRKWEAAGGGGRGDSGAA